MCHRTDDAIPECFEQAGCDSSTRRPANLALTPSAWHDAAASCCDPAFELSFGLYTRDYELQSLTCSPWPSPLTNGAAHLA